MIDETVRDRLLHYKFLQARERMTGEETDAERDVIIALATCFGDPGWFNGSLGDVVDAAICYLTGEEPIT